MNHNELLFPTGFCCVILVSLIFSFLLCGGHTLDRLQSSIPHGRGRPCHSTKNHLQHVWKSNGNRQLSPSKETMDSQLGNKSLTVSNTIFAKLHCLRWQNLLHNPHSLLLHYLSLSLFTPWNLDEPWGWCCPQNVEHGRWTPGIWNVKQILFLRTKMEFCGMWNMEHL